MPKSESQWYLNPYTGLPVSIPGAIYGPIDVTTSQDPLDDEPIIIVGTQYGWICPRCGTVHAPFVATCSCQALSVTTTSITVDP
jgi:hypothetical protein